MNLNYSSWPNKLCAICKLRPAESFRITCDDIKCIRALEAIQTKGKFKEFLEDFEKSGSGKWGSYSIFLFQSGISYSAVSTPIHNRVADVIFQLHISAAASAFHYIKQGTTVIIKNPDYVIPVIAHP